MRKEVFNYKVRVVAIWALHVSLAVVFIWFGALKLFDVSPVFNIIANAEPFITANPTLYLLLALFEIAIGIGILIPGICCVFAWIMIAHLTFATFGVLFSPQAFLQQFPYLSIVGEFVVKNFVLVAGALVIASEPQPKGHILKLWVEKHIKKLLNKKLS